MVLEEFERASVQSLVSYDLLAAVNEVQMVAVIAPIPDEVAIAASPPSSFAAFCSTEMQVGFPILV